VNESVEDVGEGLGGKVSQLRNGAIEVRLREILGEGKVHPRPGLGAFAELKGAASRLHRCALLRFVPAAGRGQAAEKGLELGLRLPEALASPGTAPGPPQGAGEELAQRLIGDPAGQGFRRRRKGLQGVFLGKERTGALAPQGG